MKKALSPPPLELQLLRRVERLRLSVKAGKSVTRQFRSLVWWYYRQAGRVHPWREVSDWYPILVSELMLQQTQVDRVLPKYEAFLARFPSACSLSTASLAEVLRHWQGLGYNRRAQSLQRCCQVVLSEFGGALPQETESLTSLPGIGSYTAAALQSFVFAQPSMVIETNIRTVYYHCFLWDQSLVFEDEIVELVTRYQESRDPRNWNYALMDLGSYLKSLGFRYNARFSGYRRQTQFIGSNRQIRGAIIRALSQKELLSRRLLEKRLVAELQCDSSRVEAALRQLCADGLVATTKKGFQLASG